MPRPEPSGPPPALPLPLPSAQVQRSEDAACQRLLSGTTSVVRREAPIAGAGGCGIAEPVTLLAVRLPSGHMVPILPPPTLRCDLAQVLTDWVRDDLASGFPAEGDLLGIGNADAYDCRLRNRQADAPLSEHAVGDAIDIVGLRFAKRAIPLNQSDAHEVWASVKVSACARFSTVLGPGSDGFHETNLHLDLKPRRGGAHLCHWDDP